MLAEDKKRLERERSIAKATAGPDYSEFEKAVRAAKAEHGKRAASQRRSDAQERWGSARMSYQRAVANYERNR